MLTDGSNDSVLRDCARHVAARSGHLVYLVRKRRQVVEDTKFPFTKQLTVHRK